MESLPLLAVAAAALGFLCTWLARRWAPRFGLIDHPDGHRKIHPRPTPVAGGVAVFLAVTAALIAVQPNSLTGHGTELGGLLAGSLLLVVAGVADDAKLIRIRHKLLAQCLAVLVVSAVGLRFDRITLGTGQPVDLGLLGWPVTWVWLLLTINAFNLLDGMDGLLGGIALLLSLAVAVPTAGTGEAWVAGVAVALAGALVGFLVFNRPPATIFLGDGGSMPLGLVQGALALRATASGPGTVAVVPLLAIFAVPLLDTTLAVVRRAFLGRSLFVTDRGHLHHCLQHQGLPVPRVLLWILGCCLVTAAGGLASLAYGQPLYAGLGVAAVAALLVGGRRLGRTELLLVGHAARDLAASFLRGPARAPRQRAIQVQGDGGWRPLWEELVAQVAALDVAALTLDVHRPACHESYHAHWQREPADDGRPRWRLDCPLIRRGQNLGRLVVQGEPHDRPFWLTVAAVVKAAHAFLDRKEALPPDRSTPHDARP